MHHRLLHLLLILFVVGCSTGTRDPVQPDPGTKIPINLKAPSQINDNHMLWGEYNLFFNNDHTSVDVVPKRQGRLHLNALKFLEEYCTDCIKVTGIHNNGDGTINLTVQITHPFPDNPEYTGFDVKGIIMFNGSYDVFWQSYYIYPFYEHFHISWKEAGDAELLNPDGYTPRWNPAWDSGSSMPIYNYWPGKYSNGTPSANLNAFINYYTDENRHMFRVNGKVSRTYHIWLPPGPLAVGYAVEACWEPPVNMPVTDPLNDFPYSANQPEPYFAELTVNNNEIITEQCCNGCSTVQFEFGQWYGPKPNGHTYYPGCLPGSSPTLFDCEDPDPTDNVYFMMSGLLVTHCGNGKHRGVAVVYKNHYETPDLIYDWLSYIPFDYEIDM